MDSPAANRRYADRGLSGGGDPDFVQAGSHHRPVSALEYADVSAVHSLSVRDSGLAAVAANQVRDDRTSRLDPHADYRHLRRRLSGTFDSDYHLRGAGARS